MPDRTLQELLHQADPMWPIIQGYLASAAHPVEVLPVDLHTAEATLLTLQVTTRSPLGTMAYETGGILVDNGWLRLLGSRSERMPESLLTWNGLGEHVIAEPLNDAFVIAHDVVGGFFAVNLGVFGNGPHDVFYFAPESLRWQDLEVPYADFIKWAITGDVAKFYASVRWAGWEQEVAELNGDKGFSFWPMLWSAGPQIGDRSRRVVPQRELWALYRDLARQLADRIPGSHVALRFTDDGRGKTS
jgi:hypothetical protein